MYGTKATSQFVPDRDPGDSHLLCKSDSPTVIAILMKLNARSTALCLKTSPGKKKKRLCLFLCHWQHFKIIESVDIRSPGMCFPTYFSILTSTLFQYFAQYCTRNFSRDLSFCLKLNIFWQFWSHISSSVGERRQGLGGSLYKALLQKIKRLGQNDDRSWKCQGFEQKWMVTSNALGSGSVC